MKRFNMNMKYCVLIIIIIIILLFKCFISNKINEEFAVGVARQWGGETDLTDLQAKCYLEQNPDLGKAFYEGDWFKGKTLPDHNQIDAAKHHWKTNGKREYDELKDIGGGVRRVSPFEKSACRTKNPLGRYDSDDNKYYVYHVLGGCGSPPLPANWANRKDWCKGKIIYDIKEFDHKFVENGRFGANTFGEDNENAQYNDIVGFYPEGKTAASIFVKDFYTIKERKDFEFRKTTTDAIEKLNSDVTVLQALTVKHLPLINEDSLKLEYKNHKHSIEPLKKLISDLQDEFDTHLTANDAHNSSDCCTNSRTHLADTNIHLPAGLDENSIYAKIGRETNTANLECIEKDGDNWTDVRCPWREQP